MPEGEAAGQGGAPPLVLHIPHASPLIPAEERRSLKPDDPALARELLAMTDAWTDRLVEGIRLPASRLIFPVSRLVVDVERFPNDADEPMAKIGMGAVYTRMSFGAVLREEDPDERARLMTRWYYPHHAKLNAAVEAALAAHGRCLIMDVHSFPSRPLPYELDQAADRPEICIGTDPWHSPFADDNAAAAATSRLGFVTALTGPSAAASCRPPSGGSTATSAR